MSFCAVSTAHGILVSRLNVAVIRAPAGAEKVEEKLQDYLTKYYENIDVRVYWGTAREFVTELWTAGNKPATQT